MNVLNRKKKAALAALLVGTSLLAACSGSGGGSAGNDHTNHPVQTAVPSQGANASPSQKSPAADATPNAGPSVAPTPSSSVSTTTKESVKPPASPSAAANVGSGQSSAGDHKSISWYYLKKGKGKVPGFPNDIKQYKPADKAVWVGTGKKVYLTLDNGGPMGDVDTMLKVLQDNNVKANFFLAGYNVKAHPEYLKRLVSEGHLVANHTMSHKDMSKLSDAEAAKEINDYEKMYTDLIGKPMPKFFRFPYGTYSLHLLDMVSQMGYTSVFWSTAMRDWEPMKGGPEQAYTDVMNNLHDGNIILLHQGSDDDIKALDKIIKGIKAEGYTFGLLSDFGG